jgi:LAO/AO transport system kinase
MEIADVFVVNKADRDNANKAVMDIQAILQLSSKEGGWKPPVLKTVALTGEGVAELVEKLEEHRGFLEKDPESRLRLLRAEAEVELVEAIKAKVVGLIVDDLRAEGKLERFLQKILRRELDPASAAEELLKEKGFE